MGRTSRKIGASRRQRATTEGQRVWKWQTEGGLIGLGVLTMTDGADRRAVAERVKRVRRMLRPRRGFWIPLA